MHVNKVFSIRSFIQQKTAKTVFCEYCFDNIRLLIAISLITFMLCSVTKTSINSRILRVEVEPKRSKVLLKLI